MGHHLRVALLAAACSAAACGRGEPAPPGGDRLPARPADTAAPGEIAEGTEDAFGLKLPRDVKVTARFPDAVFVAAPYELEPLANYVRARVDAENVETGPAKTVFDDAALKSDPNRRVRVEVAIVQRRAEIVVRERTKKPAEQGVSEEEWWKRAGLTPKGEVLPGKNQ